MDFVLHFPHTNIKIEMYVEIPQGIKTKDRIITTHVLKIFKNLYEYSRGCMLWNQHLTKALEEIGFRQSSVDNCLLYRREVIFVVYVYEGIFSYPSDTSINQAIAYITAKFDIEDQVSLNNYIGANIESLINVKINIFQPHLIDQIAQDVNLM